MNTQHNRASYDVSSQLAHIPVVTPFFHEATYTYSYVVADPETKMCAIIDSVLDFDLPSGSLSHESADAIAAFITEEGLTVEWHLETHMHADHLSAAQYLKEKLGGKVAIGSHISDIQELYRDVFHVSDEELADARGRFDHLWDDFETFTIGSLPAFTFYAPGHTPADIVYGIGDALFVGDSLFMPDFGSARCDFPSGSAEAMYDSVQQILSLPDSMRMFMCHDYLPKNGRTKHQCETTVKAQREENIHLHTGVAKADFVATREKRDATLALPVLMIPSLQVNIRAGAVPLHNEVPMLQLPVNSVFSKYPGTDPF